MGTPCGLMEMGRGGACVPAHVALQGRIYRSSPRTMRVFWYGNAAARTFGRAHRHRPYGFVWMDCAWVVGFVWWMMCGRLMSLGQITRGRFCLLGKRCTRTNTIGVVLLSAQGCRR